MDGPVNSYQRETENGHSSFHLPSRDPWSLRRLDAVMNAMKDEIVVTVFTPLGQSVGQFLWPRTEIRMLAALNGSSRGRYFHIDDPEAKAYRNSAAGVVALFEGHEIIAPAIGGLDDLIQRV